MNFDADAIASLLAAVAKQAPPAAFKCVHCPFASDHNNVFRRHTLQTHPESMRDFACWLCAFPADTADGLEEHLTELHPHICEQCGTGLESSAELEKHLATHSPGPEKELSNLMTAAAAFLQTAQIAAAAIAGGEKEDEDSSKSPRLCPYPGCGQSTRETREFLQHLKDRHEEQFEIHDCDICNFASKSPAKMARHKALVHGGEEEKARLSFKCSICPYETEEESRYKKHMRCHNSKAETSCRFCDFETVYSWNLDRHMQGHSLSGRYSCLRCSYSQNTRQSMTFHLQHHHKILKTDAESQTDAPFEAPIEVSIGREAYIFEKHAVLFRSDQKHRADSPGDEASVVKKATTEEKKPGSSVSNIKVKQYLSEQEAIETPSDERDLKEFEDDPDVQSRVCSICGYQGKWISEMIRHKRVHTNERPFRCKYCSRTSKWKADLIRHVAKVHGIRVVSKYSRSKTFDSDPSVMRAMKEAHGLVETDDSFEIQESPRGKKRAYDGFRIEKYASLGRSEGGDCVLKCRLCQFQADGVGALRTHVFQHEECLQELSALKENVGDLSPSGSLVSWQCRECPFHSQNRAKVIDHLAEKHQLPPFSCSLCDFSSMFRKTVLYHLQTKHGEHRERIKENISYHIRDTDSVESAESEELAKEAFAAPKETDTVSTTSGDASGLSESASSDSCALCPFVGGSEAALVQHRRGHEKPRGLINYKCAFCEWYAAKSHKVLDHMRLHTDNPEAFMADVQKNLITASTTSQDLVRNTETGMNNNEVEQNEDLLSTFLNRSAFSDFSAILSAAGADSEGADPIRYPSSVASPFEFVKDVSPMDTESEPEIEDKESYLHAGEDALDSDVDIEGGPSEIKKVSIVVEGDPKRMWQCRYCPHVSKRRANVRMHEKKHFKLNPVGLLKCPKCNYRGDKRSLNAHYRVHVGDDDSAIMPQRFPCKICPANFRTLKDRQLHYAFHNYKLSFACKRCEYSVSSEAALEMHERVHAGEDIKREEQQPSKNNRKSLPRPLKASAILSPTSRSGSKPKKHICPSCPAKFADTTQLSRHLRFHGHPEEHEHRCPQCDYAVPFKINLFKHIKSHHGLELDSAL